MFKKLLCFLGYHRWTYTFNDCMEEFGYIPDKELPKTAKCERCHTKFHKL